MFSTFVSIMKPKKENFTETPRTSGPMKPTEKIASPDKPVITPKEKPVPPSENK